MGNENLLNECDRELADLLVQRIKAYARNAVSPEEKSAAERKLMSALTAYGTEEYGAYLRMLFSTMNNIGESYKTKLAEPDSALKKTLEAAVEHAPERFPESATVACQGVEGAYSQQACEKLFSVPDIMFVNSFEGVFKAVSSGLCDYGVLPLENSTAGSVNKVYDLLSQYRAYIVRSARCRVEHKLLAKQGIKLTDIKEIISHEQAINQCAEFLSTLKGVKITFCENTAVAAKYAAQSDRTDIAAISSAACAELYGLKVISNDVRDEGGNDTRFICISKTPEIYPGADRTSIKLTLPHRPGSLYNILARFYAQGINIVKLESRPIPGSDFEFMFYFDASVPASSPELRELLCELERDARTLEYLGSYKETV